MYGKHGPNMSNNPINNVFVNFIDGFPHLFHAYNCYRQGVVGLRIIYIFQQEGSPILLVEHRKIHSNNTEPSNAATMYWFKDVHRPLYAAMLI